MIRNLTSSEYDAPGTPGPNAWARLAFLKLTTAMVRQAEKDARRGQAEAQAWLDWLRERR
jgi:hypothetical protein